MSSRQQKTALFDDAPSVIPCSDTGSMHPGFRIKSGMTKHSDFLGFGTTPQKFFFIVFVFGIMTLFTVTPKTFAATASTPQFLVTWQAQTYTPPEYLGKALPTAKSRIFVQFELVDGGKVVNLAGQTIYWYLDDDQLRSATGKQSVSLVAPEVPGNVMRVRIQLPNYNNGLLLKTIEIPTVYPDVTIVSPYPGNVASTQNITLKARPYFFNVGPEDLVFSWLVNDVEPVDYKNPDTLNINLGALPTQTTTLPVSLTVKNPFADFEAATHDLTLTVKP